MSVRESPEQQVLAALAVAKHEQLPAEEAWQLATGGHVCDSYTSARGNRPDPTASLEGPPRLRASVGEQRCAGCRFIIQPGRGLARCALYETPVFAGVVWPPRTDDRREWKAAITSTASEWLAAYGDLPTPAMNLVSILAAVIAGTDHRDADELRGSVAA